MVYVEGATTWRANGGGGKRMTPTFRYVYRMRIKEFMYRGRSAAARDFSGLRWAPLFTPCTHEVYV